MRGFGCANLAASFVVLLVAIPFCARVAAASGLGLQAGLVTALVGGLVAAPLGGARLQVSGPSVGLASVVLALVAAHGAAALPPALLLAGLLQLLAGLAGGGALMQLMSAPVLAGAVCTAGLTQATAQLIAATGHPASVNMLSNIAALPSAIDHPAAAELGIAGLTLAVLVAWRRLPPGLGRVVPGPVAAVLAGTALSLVWPRHVAHFAFQPFTLPDMGHLDLARAWHSPDVLAAACLIAAIGSAESLVSAEATTWASSGPILLRRNRELVAQGVGNALCGLLGGLPLAGAIPRSAANMGAGARGASSVVLHAVLLLVALVVAPGLLRALPVASLSALLLLGGWRLAFERTRLTAMVDRADDVAVFMATLVAGLSWTLAAGIAAGSVAACAFAALRLASFPRLAVIPAAPDLPGQLTAAPTT